LVSIGGIYAGRPGLSTPAIDLMGFGIGMMCNWERNLFMNSCPYASGAYIESFASISNVGAGTFGPPGPPDNLGGNNYDFAATLDVSLVTFNIQRLCYAAGWVTKPETANPYTKNVWPLGVQARYGMVVPCDAGALAGGTVDVYLDAANPNFGAQYLIVDSSGNCAVGNEIIIHAKAGETINGAATYTINTARGAVTLVSVADGPSGVYDPFVNPGGTFPVKNPIVGQWIISSKVV
jgi:hypothetical protein